MDTTAQNPSTSSAQQPAQTIPVQSQTPQSTGGVQPDTISTSVNVSQSPASPAVTQSDPVPQPISGGHPEQAPGNRGLPPREVAPVDETESVATVSDDQAVVPDEATDADNKQQEAADVKMQESHPQVEVSKELQEAGVEKGEDADRDKLPEEQIAKADDAAKQPDTQASASGVPLPMTAQQAEEVKKKSKIRDSIKWLAELILYHWKKLQVKGDKVKE